ncbi:MAG: cobaltochelatase subunit CobN, partial [Cyanobacteria bacterium J06649_4]
MHRLAATPGGWDSSAEGVVFIDQVPAPIVFLTAADTDIAVLSKAIPQLPEDFSEVRSVNLLQLQQQLTIDTYAEDVLRHARLIILRMLGGRAYWSYGLEVAKATAIETGATLVVMPGDDKPDLDLMSHSTTSLAIVNRLWQYFTEGGITNVCNGLMYASDFALSSRYAPVGPKAIPKVGIYPLSKSLAKPLSKVSISPQVSRQQSNNQISLENKQTDVALSLDKSAEQTLKNRFAKSTELKLQETVKIDKKQAFSPTNELEFKTKEDGFSRSKVSHTSHDVLPERRSSRLSSQTASVGILFYRAHYLAGNTDVIEAIAQALHQRNLTPIPIYVSSLKDIDVQQVLIDHCQTVDILINTTSFAITSLNSPTAKSSNEQKNLWQTLNIPILQAICSGSPREHWRNHSQGLTPRDIAMNVALPEVDGRIITRAVSFKAVQSEGAEKESLQTDVVRYAPESDRIQFVCDLAARWIELRRTRVAERKVALILANYPNRDGRMANGVGLDTPASCLEILRSLQQAGYTVTDLPQTSDELMSQLAAGITNDPEGHGLRPVHQALSLDSYRQFFETLSPLAQAGITQRWGSPTEEWQRFKADLSQSAQAAPSLPISGIQFGNVFVGIQPSRGYDIDPTLNYHAPDLEPTHAYMGFYCWLRSHFQAQAIVHVGKHGNLEWLPGKGIALSQDCYPEAAFGPLPHFYPFIVNDPGEGAQAKRRAQAVILDHLTPPMTRAELYGPLQQLESLVDEYYEAQNLDPSRLRIISPKIVELLKRTELQQDLNLAVEKTSTDLQTWLPQIDGYLCELKEAQIRDGLHIYGQCPQGEQLRD